MSVSTTHRRPCQDSLTLIIHRGSWLPLTVPLTA
jgi:hypothetical protein